MTSSFGKMLQVGTNAWTAGDDDYIKKPITEFSEFDRGSWLPSQNDYENRALAYTNFQKLGAQQAPSMGTGADVRNAKDVQAPALGQAIMAQSTAAGYQPSINAAYADAASMDRTEDTQWRLQQQQLASMQMRAAQGNGPSLATSTMGQGVAGSLAAQNASLASARGANAGTAMRLSAQNAAAQRQQANIQAAQMRVQEALQARAELGQTTYGARAQDISVSAQQANLDSAAIQANANRQQTSSMANAQLAQQVELANAAAQNQMSLANAAAQNQYGITSYQGGMTAALANQAAQQQVELQKSAYEQEAMKANQAAQLQNTATTTQAQLAYLEQMRQMEQFAENRQATQAQLKYGQVKDAYAANLKDADERKKAAEGVAGGIGDFITNMATGGLGGIGDMFSDYRTKENVKPASKGIGRFLDSINGWEYDYKPEFQGKDGGATGTFVSPMAQELEKTPMGQSMVSIDEDTGMRKVNYQRGLGAMLASMADLHRRTKALEGRV